MIHHAGYSLSTRTGVVLGPDGRPVGRVTRATMNPREWVWGTHGPAEGIAKTRAAALAALTAHLDKEAVA